MAEPPAVAPKPCCVCDAPGGKHCTLCKSRHYCSKKCQVVDWKRGHNKACKQMAADFQDRLLDALMPAKKPKEAPAIVEDASPADGSKARLSAVRAAKTAEASAPSDDMPGWRGICAICLDLLPFGVDETFFTCCCKKICTACDVKCRQHDLRCPLCRSPPSESNAEAVRRLQKHVDKGNALAQFVLGGMYRDGGMGLQQDVKRAVQLYERAAAQGLPYAQYCLGMLFYKGKGVAQSYDEAVRWYRLAGAQGYPNALFNLGACHANGHGVPQDLDEALRLFKRAAAKGHAGAVTEVERLAAFLASARAV